jgi:hypothetical protein
VHFADLVNGFAAWNDHAFVVLPMEQSHMGKREGAVPDRMRLWVRPALDQALAKHFATAAAERRPRPVVAEKLLAPAWEISRSRFFACALTPAAVVAAFGEWDEQGADERPAWARPGDRWFVGAFSLAGGSELWRVPLPGVPLEDGLAITADGTVLVQLLNGPLCAVGAP